MKKSTFVLRLVGCLVALIICALGKCFMSRGRADERVQSEQTVAPFLAAEDDKEDIPSRVDDLLNNLDLSGVQSLLNTLDGDAIALFGFSDIYERVRAVASGQYKADINSVFSYAFGIVGINLFAFLPMMFSLLAIFIAYDLITSVRGRLASEQIERVVYFAAGTVAVCIIVGYFSSALSDAVSIVAAMKNQINTVAPVLLTLMTASGATSSAGVYTPAVAILGGGMANAVTYTVFPMLLMGLVFDIIGSVSTSVKLDKTADFFRSACKWFLGTTFFLFVTLMGVFGITASVRDGITVRAARFAVSKYVPVIGGYLSQGFDFIMAGNVLIKNALGASAVAIIALSVAPVIARLVIFTLTLKLTAAIAEPLGGDRLCSVLTSVTKSSSMIATSVIAMTFLYMLFLTMMICTGNSGS